MKFLCDLLHKKKQVIEVNTALNSLAPKVLTKKEDIAKIQPYLDKLKEAIQVKDINNIAITGSYGSGKSTILKTFSHLHSENVYLNISLAAFNQQEDVRKIVTNEEEDNVRTESNQKEELERLLEVSILQQLFYQVPPSKIPESRFKRIINLSDCEFFLKAVCFSTWVLSLILLLKYNYLDKINPKSWSSQLEFDWTAFIIIVIGIAGLGYLSKSILQIFNNSKVHKVNIKGEVELGDNINNSIFNQYLEEIIYFFERTDYNVVIIEDLDRFFNTDIFTKLREINILLNKAELINRDIKFIYAIGDDLFKDKNERVKFFEFIIPVIPFINSSNADVQLQTLIKESGLEKDIFSGEFISDVVTFIDDIDMRLLINIFHEFVIYRQTLNPKLIKKPEELFSIITYKNLEPSDFAKLNRKEGKLYNLINNKAIYIKDFLVNVDNEIQEHQIKIRQIEDEFHTNLKELRTIYVTQIISKLPSNALPSSSFNDFLEDEEFENLKTGKLFYTHFALNYGINYQKRDEILEFDFSEIEKKVSPTYKYEERVEFITSKVEDNIYRIQEEIEQLKVKKTEIELWELKQIFEEVDLNLYLNAFSNNSLLRSLILNGYINENYNDYISLFHEGSITSDDITFERNVKGGYNSNFDYKLSDKKEILIERINLRYFSREAILNFDLLDFLGNNHEKYNQQYNAIISLLSNEHERSLEFIDKYIIDESRPIKLFIESLIKKWRNFFYYIVHISNYPRIKLFLIYGY